MYTHNYTYSHSLKHSLVCLFARISARPSDVIDAVVSGGNHLACHTHHWRNDTHPTCRNWTSLWSSSTSLSLSLTLNCPRTYCESSREPTALNLSYIHPYIAKEKSPNLVYISQSTSVYFTIHVCVYIWVYTYMYLRA